MSNKDKNKEESKQEQSGAEDTKPQEKIEYDDVQKELIKVATLLQK